MLWAVGHLLTQKFFANNATFSTRLRSRRVGFSIVFVVFFDLHHKNTKHIITHNACTHTRQTNSPHTMMAPHSALEPLSKRIVRHHHDIFYLELALLEVLTLIRCSLSKARRPSPLLSFDFIHLLLQPICGASDAQSAPCRLIFLKYIHCNDYR